MVEVENITNCKVKFARCCMPIPGDEIAGYITFSNGVSIHRKDCKSLNNLDYNTRKINVKWKNKAKANFVAKIRVKANNRDTLISNSIFTSLSGSTLVLNFKTSNLISFNLEITSEINVSLLFAFTLILAT